jgi:osmoprotectant transport system permease protein
VTLALRGAAPFALFATLALTASPGRALAADARPIVVGSKRFPESAILAEIAVATLRRAGIAAEHRAGLGGTAIVWSAVREGSVDVYPEYTGTLVHTLTGEDRPLDDAALGRALEGVGLRVSPRLGFENTYALAVTGVGKTAELRTIGDLKRAPGLTIGMSPEFLGRRDGWLGLCAAYSLCDRPTSALDHGLAYDALAKGSIDVTDAYATDAKIERQHLRVLVDDVRFFPPYDALFVERATLSPAAHAALARLGGAIDATAMRSLNAAVELDGHTPGEAAERFVAGRDARAGGSAMRTSFAGGLLAVIVDEGPRHLLLVFASLVAAIAIGVPLGVLAHERRRLGRTVLTIAGLVQTIPSLALFSFFIPLFGIGTTPALVALSIYALLPIVRNTYVGLSEVPAPQREAAVIMDLSWRTRLLSIELPLASRTILAGIRTSAIIGVGTATIAAFIGAGGFGVAISAGLSLADASMILQGALPAAGLALGLEGVFALADRWLIPRGLRLASAQAQRSE